jgi:Cu-Zn family superoxide dismutase
VYFAGMKIEISKRTAGLSAVAVALLFAGVSARAEEPTKAIAVLHPTQGSQVTGSVTFTESGGAVKVVADISGLTPGKHGFHIHEFGDCSDPKGASAGGHFNPGKHSHGAPDAADRHEGDLGNIEADASGKAHLEVTDKVMKLTGANGILGRAVIVHEKADDLKTQPTGDAGGRLACGVVGVAKP